MITGSPSRSSPALSFFSQVNNIQRSTSLNDGPVETEDGTDVRRVRSLRVSGPHGGARRDMSDMSTFSAAAGGLSGSSPQYIPPAAARHPLFSHHSQAPGSPSSDAGMSGATTPSEPSSSAFSPASNFLSHFSSTSSLRLPQEQAQDSQGAVVLSYVLGKVIGRGGFSTVRKVTHSTSGEIHACKIVKRDDLSDRSGSLEKFEEEIKTWQSLPPHPSLLPLLDMHRTPTTTFLFIPYLPGGSLLDVLRREGGSPKAAAKWFPGIVAAVSAMHEGYGEFDGGMLHGDLKLDNFLVDHNAKVVVCDFYMAQLVNGPFPTASTPRSSSKGRALPAVEPLQSQPFPSASLPYAPPELLRTPPSQPSLAQDIWALGVILHALLTGRLPFVDQFDPRLQMKILRGAWEVPPWLGKEWVECLKGCLDVNVQTRWDIRRIRECDAVIGWHEVRSRSRSRARGRSNSRHDLDPIHTPRRQSQSRGPRLEVFTGPRSRSASASGSRSRSGGASDIFGFQAELTAESMQKLQNISIDRDRGRSPLPSSSSASFSRSLSNSRTPIGMFDNPSAKSRSRSRKRESPVTANTPLDSGAPTPRARSGSRSAGVNRDFGSYAGDLGVVTEEGERGRRGRDGQLPGLRGRSKSRGRSSGWQ